MSGSPLSPLSQSVFTSAIIDCERSVNVAHKLRALGLRYRRARLVAQEISDCGIAVVDWGVKGYQMELDEPLIAGCIALPHLVSPVSRIIRTAHRVPVPKFARLAGMTALASIIRIKPPATRRLAIFHEDADEYLDQETDSRRDSQSFDEVELWNVPPASISHSAPHVDLLSLYLCFREQSNQGSLALLRRELLSLWSPPHSKYDLCQASRLPSSGN